MINHLDTCCLVVESSYYLLLTCHRGHTAWGIFHSNWKRHETSGQQKLPPPKVPVSILCGFLGALARPSTSRCTSRWKSTLHGDALAVRCGEDHHGAAHPEESRRAQGRGFSRAIPRETHGKPMENPWTSNDFHSHVGSCWIAGGSSCRSGWWLMMLRKWTSIQRRAEDPGFCALMQDDAALREC